MVLFDTFVPLPPKFELTPVIEAVPPTQLLKVLPVIVLVGAFVAEAPLRLLQPIMLVAPVTVIFEKLLLLLLWTTPFTSRLPSVKPVTEPPAPVLENPVTIELPLMV